MARIKILYCDNDLLVVIKPGGLLAVPGRGPDKQDCLVSRLRASFLQLPVQPAVHRLDMATSGVMVLAMNADAHRDLSWQFAAGTVHKRYIALLDGIICEDRGEINLPLRLDPDNRPMQIYDPVHGKKALTLWKKLAIENNRTRIEFEPKTGRTHQLRLHAAHPMGLGVPIVGDSLYGNGKIGDAMHLHAVRLVFIHPRTREQLVFEDDPDF